MSEDIQKLQLEIGGSVFELIEFSLTRRIRGKVVKGIYGVNVAKVREVVRMPKINPLSSRIKGVAGVFELRGIPIPAVNLAVALGDDDEEPLPNQQIIVTEFSQKRAGFIVDSTRRIRRVGWDKVMPPSADAGTCINGMTLIDNHEFLFILDLERILATLEQTGHVGPPGMGMGGYPGQPGNPLYGAPGGHPYPGYASGPAQAQGQPPKARVLLVDDSQFIRNGVKQALVRDGYQVVEAGDGAEAYKLLEESLGGGRSLPFAMMISDVEMPRMDGLSLTRKVREHAQLRDLPIILHTSLSGRNNQAAGLSVGATAYVVKNDLQNLLAMMHKVLTEGADALSA